MRIATSTNLVSFNRDGSKTEMTQLIGLYAQGGFSCLDLNFCEMLNEKSILCSDEYGLRTEELQRLKEKYHLIYNQSHAPYGRDRLAMGIEEGAHLDMLISRSITISAQLGIKNIVMHPLCAQDAIIEKNVTYLSPFINQAERLGVNIALENLDSPLEIRDASTLVALIKRLGSRHCGVCFDFGHAHMNNHDLGKDIATYGSSLIATHVADNHGSMDEHLLPFYGTIDWKTCMDSLRNINYTGDLTFECMKMHANLPPSLKLMAIRDALRIGQYLLTL